jgi:hypothetical protein
MKCELWSVLLCGFTCVALTSPSSAGDRGIGWDYKAQPGAACQPQIGAQSGDFERYPHYILNVSKTTRTVICPVIRDSATQTDLDIGVAVSRASGTGREGGVNCTFYSMNTFGDTIGTPHQPSQIVVENVPGPNREIQYFSVKKAESAFDGSFALLCILQPSAKIYRFNSGELALSTDYGE